MVSDRQDLATSSPLPIPADRVEKNSLMSVTPRQRCVIPLGRGFIGKCQAIYPPKFKGLQIFA